LAVILAIMTELQMFNKDFYGTRKKPILHMVLHRMQDRQLYQRLQQEEQRQGQKGAQEVLQALP
jgi:hypothetical protein